MTGVGHARRRLARVEEVAELDPQVLPEAFEGRSGYPVITGDYAGAQKAADEAKKWAMWSAISSVIIWVLIIIVYVVLFVILLGASASTSTY